jgi:hypothetical protein
MLTKIGNVEVSAYSDQNYSTHLHTLGGHEVRSDAYIAGKPTGFLSTPKWNIADQFGTIKTTDNSFRTPPFITSADIELNDHSFGLLNTAIISIVIPNPDRDLAFIESVFARPGRATRMTIAHPTTALANKTAVLQKDPVPAGFEIFTDEPTTNETAPLINQVVFEGLVISFDYMYQVDGTVALTIYLRGKSDVFTDVTMYISDSKSKNDGTNKTQATTFYSQLYNEIDDIISGSVNANIQPRPAYGIAGAYPSKQGTNDYVVATHTDWNKNQQRYISLAYLISNINKVIFSKYTTISSNALIYCNDSVCFSSKFDDIISADPINIWLYKSDQYGTYENTTKPRSWNDGITLLKNSGEMPSFQDAKQGYPSRILLNLNLIESIYNSIQTDKDDFIVSKFLSVLSKQIYNATGGAINMKLITFRDTVMLYYDANYLGDIYRVTSYSVPMFANHPSGSVVRDFSIQSKLPQNAQSLMYTINQSSTISEEMIAPYMSFMYNNDIITRDTNTNTETRTSSIDAKKQAELEKKYAEFHEKYKSELADAKQKFNLTDNQTKIALETALKKYIQYPSKDIKTANQMLCPIYPVEVDFTIDGINGLKFGDALEFKALPARYKTNTTFSIIRIKHTINTNGDWTTKITCIMRPKF